MANPYATPSADLSEPRSATGRPVLVWVIALWVSFSAILVPLGTVAITSGASPFSAAARTQLAALGYWLWAQLAVSTLLSVWFSVTLFRLKAAAVRLAIAMLGLEVLRMWVDFSGSNVTSGQYLYYALDFSFSIAIYLYTRHLRSRGVLR